ncbi:E3 SUMO-protein ligase ZBED1-like [Drosophila ficusphila]|uniref:E3 SUMO-protein ligase ZBED1-like n=1 Tax=Drosophila ficusphila TaxID=30025 RepID=UPI001C8A8B5A|nr:E3 SUMO-protein ligase ZBED1-like [Drosophila ficusphila]
MDKFLGVSESGSAKCVICGHVNKSCGNTTNLFNHLKRAHPTVLSVPKGVARIADFFDTNSKKTYENGSFRKSSLDKALISMIATDLQPFRIVEGAGFRNFVYCLDPQYTLPCRRTLNDVLLSNMYEDIFDIKSAVLCTSKLLNDLDHMSENIASSLHEVLSEWGVASNVSAIVTDNASSMIKSCSIVGKRHMPCFAHTLNLIMQESLQ